VERHAGFAAAIAKRETAAEQGLGG